METSGLPAGTTVAHPNAELRVPSRFSRDPRGPGLLAELARINTAIAPLAMRIMDGSASAAEQAHYADKLITVGKRLQRRADETAGPIIAGEVVAEEPLAVPVCTVEPYQGQ